MESAWDIVCLAHLRWEPVKQRPHHLMREAARGRRVLYVQEPKYGGQTVLVEMREVEPNITILVPTIPDDLPPSESDQLHASVIAQAITALGFERFVLWFYSPMLVTVTTGLAPVATVYDCMDDLASFTGAPRSIQKREAAVLEQADVVFTGGMSLYAAKRDAHPHVYPFPSSVDVAHFRTARCQRHDPDDQDDIPRSRLGFFGVIDERIDLELMAGARLADRDGRPGCEDRAIIATSTKQYPLPRGKAI